MLSALTPAGLCALMRQAGYGAEVARGAADSPLRCSAGSGVPFEMRFFDPASGDGVGYADVTLTACLRLRREVPLDIVDRWNSNVQFARLHVSRDHLILAMEIVIVAGISPADLVTRIELWDRLLRELLAYSQVPATSDAPAAATAPPAGRRAFAGRR